MTERPNLSGLTALANALGRPIIIFDLETTTFRGKPNFGITEASFMLVLAGGEAEGIIQYGSLVNPQAAIDEKVQELTGITPAMVAKERPWNEVFMQHVAEWAPVAYFVGFNSQTFDVPALCDQAVRYGAPVPTFPYQFDVRELHLSLSGVTGRRGTLLQVAAHYGVKPRGKLHRSAADVLLTAETLSTMVQLFGVGDTVSFVKAEAARPPEKEPKNKAAAAKRRAPAKASARQLVAS